MFTGDGAKIDIEFSVEIIKEVGQSSKAIKLHLTLMYNVLNFTELIN